MYVVTTVKLHDNNTIEVETAENRRLAEAKRQERIDNLLLLFSEHDFNVIGHPFDAYVTVANDADKSPWLVSKISKISD